MRNFLFKKVLSRVRTRSNVLIQNISQSVVQYHRKKNCFKYSIVPLFSPHLCPSFMVLY